MFIYYLSKAYQDQLLREAEQDQLIKTVKGVKREAGKLGFSKVSSWVNRRLHATHA